MLDPKLLDQIIDVAAISAYKSSLLKAKEIKMQLIKLPWML